MNPMSPAASAYNMKLETTKGEVDQEKEDGLKELHTLLDSTTSQHTVNTVHTSVKKTNHWRNLQCLTRKCRNGQKKEKMITYVTAD
jgi:hypothetical protein